MFTNAAAFGPKNDCAGEGQQQTRHLVIEVAPRQQTLNCLTVIKILSWAPDGVRDTKTDWPTDRWS
jgi:hypothetical protein